jgi:bleomycin hydrolase
MSTEFRSNSKNILAMNAITQSQMSGVLVSRDASMQNRHVYSHHIAKECKATNQKASGRCWLFATLNVLRLDIIKRYKLDEFEFSQSYIFWFDKLEKCSWFLDSIVKTAQEPLDGRLVQHLLHNPVQDGGQWDMAESLIEKYGLVPKSAFPESAHSGATANLNWLITFKLREAASVLRNLVAAEGAESAKVTAEKERVLTEIYKIMSITLGEPPQNFDWNFRNKDKAYQCFEGLTPMSFYKDHVQRDVSQMVSLIHDPRNEYYKLYSVEYLGNVVGGRPVIYVNLPISELKKYASMVIRGDGKKKETPAAAAAAAAAEEVSSDVTPTPSHANEAVGGDAVWFGCDVGKFSDRMAGVMDLDYYDYKSAFDVSFGLNKADRLRYGESAMTHAMTLNAVHMSKDNKDTIRWRVENSWGTDRGENGYFTMSDSWFDEYVYQIVVDKSILSEEIKSVIEKETPVVFPPWDPLGALA